MNFLTLFYRFLLLLSLLLAVTTTAHADLQSTVSINVDPVQLKAALHQLPPAQRAKLLTNPLFKNGSIHATFFVSGDKTRIDYDDLDGLGPVSIIKNNMPLKAIMLLRSVDRYMILPEGFDDDPGINQANIQVIPTSDTEILLGHTVHKYQLIISEHGITESGEIWTAPDLPALPSSVFSQSPMIQQVWEKVQGMPLEMTMDLLLPEPLTIKYQVLSLSTTALPVSIFKMPSGYKLLPKG